MSHQSIVWNGKVFLQEPMVFGAHASVSEWTAEMMTALQTRLTDLQERLEEDLDTVTRTAITAKAEMVMLMLDKIRGAVATTIDDL